MADPGTPRQPPVGCEVRDGVYVWVAAAPISQPQRVDDHALCVPAHRSFTEGESGADCPAEELRCGDALALGVAERITPCDLDLGQRSVGERVSQLLFGG